MRYDLRNAAFALALTAMAGSVAWAQTTTSGVTTSGTTTAAPAKPGTPSPTTRNDHAAMTTMPNANKYAPQNSATSAARR